MKFQFSFSAYSIKFLDVLLLLLLFILSLRNIEKREKYNI